MGITCENEAKMFENQHKIVIEWSEWIYKLGN